MSLWYDLYFAFNMTWLNCNITQLYQTGPECTVRHLTAKRDLNVPYGTLQPNGTLLYRTEPYNQTGPDCTK